MRPDLVVEREVVRDLLGELRRVGDLALAKLLESAVGAHDYAGRSSSQSLPPDCRQDASPHLNTAEYGPAPTPRRTLDRAAHLHTRHYTPPRPPHVLSLIHISEPTRLGMISYAVF